MFAQYEVNNILATASGLRRAALALEHPTIANVTLNEGPRPATISEREVAITMALLASGADGVCTMVAGTNFSGRRIYVTGGTIRTARGTAYARHVLAEAAERVLMTIESITVRDEGMGVNLVEEAPGVVRFNGVVFY